MSCRLIVAVNLLRNNKFAYRVYQFQKCIKKKKLKNTITFVELITHSQKWCNSYRHGGMDSANQVQNHSETVYIALIPLGKV